MRKLCYCFMYKVTAFHIWQSVISSLNIHRPLESISTLGNIANLSLGTRDEAPFKCVLEVFQYPISKKHALLIMILFQCIFALSFHLQPWHSTTIHIDNIMQMHRIFRWLIIVVWRIWKKFAQKKEGHN